MNTKALQHHTIYTVSTRTLFYLLAALLIVIFMLYVYLMDKTVLNVVARQNAEKNISSISSAIGNLEFQDLALKDGITLNLAYSLGFQDVTPTQFISRSGSGAALSYNDQQ